MDIDVPNICEMYLRPFKRPFTFVAILARVLDLVHAEKPISAGKICRSVSVEMMRLSFKSNEVKQDSTL